MFSNIYRKRRVLVTGHTGFKGSWLSVWLKQLGAEVCGVSLDRKTFPAAADRDCLCDIRNAESLEKIFESFQPEIVFHLAAQALVRRSYSEPAETFFTNVQGTVNVLECCRRSGTVRALVLVSSDKCYENRETLTPYRESDPLGGFDPYSASKGAMEIVIRSYQRSFFQSGNLLAASARAGNVIGGGDMAEDRLIPDLVRAYRAGRKEYLRNPDSIRPWQHVLEPLSGYLLLGKHLFSGDRHAARPWNFGPENTAPVKVGEVARKFVSALGGPELGFASNTDAPHEAALLRLDPSDASRFLGWHSVWDLDTSIRKTAAWYRDEKKNSIKLMQADLDDYCREALRQKLIWTCEK